MLLEHNQPVEETSRKPVQPALVVLLPRPHERACPSQGGRRQRLYFSFFLLLLEGAGAQGGRVGEARGLVDVLAHPVGRGEDEGRELASEGGGDGDLQLSRPVVVDEERGRDAAAGGCRDLGDLMAAGSEGSLLDASRLLVHDSSATSNLRQQVLAELAALVDVSCLAELTGETLDVGGEAALGRHL
eukprot:767240-Hanusia_phi.AAC.7